MITEICVAVIGMIGLISAAVINKKLNTIHVLVNSRLTDALKEITSLKEYIDTTLKVTPKKE